jgi:hypothetical protein
VSVLILLICPLPLSSLYFYNKRALHGKIPFRPNETFKGSFESMRNIYILTYFIYLVIAIAVCLPFYVQHYIRHYIYWALIAFGTSLLEAVFTILWMKKIDTYYAEDTSAPNAEVGQQNTPFFSKAAL